MARKVVVRKNRYFDSVFLMAVARRIASQPGILDASALLATEANRAVLTGMGYGQGDAEFAAAGPNDLLLALEGEPAARGGRRRRRRFVAAPARPLAPRPATVRQRRTR